MKPPETVQATAARFAAESGAAGSVHVAIAARRGVRAIRTNAAGDALDPDRIPVGAFVKPMVATALAQLARARVLSFEDALARWLPELDALRTRVGVEPTILDAATHTMGLQPTHGLLGLAQQAARRDAGLHALLPPALEQAPRLALRAPRDIAKLVADEATASALPDVPSYSNDGFALLGAVIERASGLSFEDALDEWVARPLGLRDTGPSGHRRLGRAYSSATGDGFATSVRDLAILFRAIGRDGARYGLDPRVFPRDPLGATLAPGMFIIQRGNWATTYEHWAGAYWNAYMPEGSAHAVASPRDDVTVVAFVETPIAPTWRLTLALHERPPPRARPRRSAIPIRGTFGSAEGLRVTLRGERAVVNGRRIRLSTGKGGLLLGGESAAIVGSGTSRHLFYRARLLAPLTSGAPAIGRRPVPGDPAHSPQRIPDKFH